MMHVNIRTIRNGEFRFRIIEGNVYSISYIYWVGVWIYFYTPAPQRGRGVYCFTSVRLSVQDIWSQAAYRYTILWVAFLDPSDSYFLFADLVGLLYTLIIYAHFSSHFSQQLLMAEI